MPVHPSLPQSVPIYSGSAVATLSVLLLKKDQTSSKCLLSFCPQWYQSSSQWTNKRTELKSQSIRQLTKCCLTNLRFYIFKRKTINIFYPKINGKIVWNAQHNIGTYILFEHKFGKEYTLLLRKLWSEGWIWYFCVGDASWSHMISIVKNTGTIGSCGHRCMQILLWDCISLILPFRVHRMAARNTRTKHTSKTHHIQIDLEIQNLLRI